MTKGGCKANENGCEFQEAQNLCKTVFGYPISGYVFEPTNLEVNNAVLKAAKDALGGIYIFWIGVSNGDFRLGNTGYGVSSPGIENQKEFFLKDQHAQRKLLNFEN